MPTQRPSPPAQEDRDRWIHSATRYRMLTGEQDEDLLEWAGLVLSEERLNVLGQMDTSSNAFKQWAKLLSVTYRQAPTLSGARPVVDALHKAGHWLRMKRTQYLTLGLRECLVRPYWTAEGLQVRTAFPHNVLAWGTEDRPDEPVELWELRSRTTGKEAVYAWDRWNIRNPKSPTVRVFVGAGADERDVTADVAPAWLGAYPHFRRDGTPFIPFVVYRAEQTGQMWDARHEREVVHGSLNAALLSTLALRAARDVGGNCVALDNAVLPKSIVKQTGQSGNVASMTLEAGAFVELGRVNPNEAVHVHVIPPGAQIEELRNFARSAERDALTRAGIHPPDPTAQHGDPRSGYAIAMDDAGRRELAMELEDLFRGPDLQLAAMVGSILSANGFPADDKPEAYQIAYYRMPPTAEEMKARRAQTDWEIQRGYRSEVDAYLEGHPGQSREQAVAELVRIKVERAAIEQMAADQMVIEGLQPVAPLHPMEPGQGQIPPAPTPQGAPA